jgi:hypothetical protein
MDRRELLGVLGVGTAGLFLAKAGEVQADDKEAGNKHEHIRTIGACVVACNEAAHHCLEQLKKGGGEHREHHAKAHELTMDCQAFCVLTATLAARSSPLSHYAHQACAEACRCCAEECEKGEGEVMKTCAQRCRDCERVCKQMCKEGCGEEKSGSRSAKTS